MCKISITIILFSILFTMVSGEEFNNSKEMDEEFSCNQRMENEMENAFTQIIVVGQKSVKFPENERQIVPYCNLAHKTFNLVQKYGQKCVPPFGQMALKLIMHIVGVELKGVCRTGRISKRARELLRAAPCANSGLERWQTCYQELIDKLTGMMTAPLRLRIPMGCCNFHQLIQCLTEEAEEVKECTKRTVDYLIKYFHKIIDPIVMILCNEYSEPNDRCDQMVRITPNITEGQKRYLSFLKPVINLAMSLVTNEEFIDELSPRVEANDKTTISSIK